MILKTNKYMMHLHYNKCCYNILLFWISQIILKATFFKIWKNSLPMLMFEWCASQFVCEEWWDQSWFANDQLPKPWKWQAKNEVQAEGTYYLCSH